MQYIYIYIYIYKYICIYEAQTIMEMQKCVGLGVWLRGHTQNSKVMKTTRGAGTGAKRHGIYQTLILVAPRGRWGGIWVNLNKQK